MKVKIESYAEFDFSDWKFGDLSGLIAKQVARELRGALKAAGREGGLRAEWEWTVDEDPTTISVKLPFGKYLDSDPCITFSVAKLVMSELKDLGGSDDESLPARARDAFLAIAAAIHKTHIPKEGFPEIEDVDVPASYFTKTSLDDFWAWETYAAPEKLVEHFEKEVAEAEGVIRMVRERKIQLETALMHYRKLAAEGAGPDSPPT